MNTKKDLIEKSALDIIEESVHILRLSPLSLLGCYYAGSVPFVLGLLYFWADMSRSGFADQYCSLAALGLVLLFSWMKCWHSVFAQKIFAAVSNTQTPKLNISRALYLISSQTIIHSSGIFFVPLSMIFCIPFPWVYAFYQNASLFFNTGVSGTGESIKTLSKKSWKQAKLWPGQNHILIFVLSFFAFFVFLNLCIFIYLLPHLLKKFFGIETLFTMSGFNVFNTTFIAAVSCTTHLCIDPLIKTVYTLRCFYGLSVKSGQDIKSGLKFISSSSGRAIYGLVVFFMILASTAQARNQDQNLYQNNSHNTGQTTQSLAEELDNSITKVLQEREFAWRMPRTKPQEQKKEDQGFLGYLLDWIGQKIDTFFDWVGDWFEKFENWLKSIMPDPEPQKPGPDINWASSVRNILYALLGILGILFAILLWQILKNKTKPVKAAAGKTIPDIPDLRDEDVQADALSTDQWIKLAKELMDKGEMRLALRAVYLGMLSMLAQADMISIAGYKSNREYEKELNRRAHDKKDLLNIFSHSVCIFDSVWYGKQQVTQKEISLFNANHERITGFVKEQLF